jgi:hypothetical protein
VAFSQIQLLVHPELLFLFVISIGEIADFHILWTSSEKYCFRLWNSNTSLRTLLLKKFIIFNDLDLFWSVLFLTLYLCFSPQLMLWSGSYFLEGFLLHLSLP